MEDEIKFAADGMLGRLAKYLRALGFDTLYSPLLGSRIFYRCEKEVRVLVTARGSIPESFTCRVIFVQEGQVEEQIAKVCSELGIRPSRDHVLTICLECNEPTREVPLSEVADRVPAGVKEHMSKYRLCSKCGRVYWWGSHADRIVERLERSGVFGGNDS